MTESADPSAPLHQQQAHQQEPQPESSQDGEQDAGQAPEPQPLRFGYETGMMPGKWIERWRDRFPGTELAEQQLEPGTWRELLGEDVDVALVRLPAHPQRGSDDLEGLRGHYRAIEVYQELQVVVLPTENELTLHDEVPLADLAGEWLLQDLSDLPEHVPSATGAGTDDDGNPRSLPEMQGTEEAIELVAAEVGLLVVPMSVARWYHRKDLTYRVVPELPPIAVVMVWPQDLPEDTEAMVQELVGVVRGRKKDSSRSSHHDDDAPAPQRAASPGKKGKANQSKPGTTKLKPGERPVATAKGTSRGDQLKGKRMAGRNPRRPGKPGRPGTRSGGGRKRR
ncbi:hypothetical protein FCK90_11005 [Kocuria coralli]|uniref:LysR substrate-binding domain-containing protein n=1 Tax=Kocuria coralli TaxID=1461025 RepID=A0A5J5KVY4_9MICC|nr:LysR substrate-binding domain-containing protein [Kocuria coralli]KAA9393702.1 hypothetical protein FCK90_11005 [Kocuria coralli]